MFKLSCTSSTVPRGASVRFPPWLLITDGGLSGISSSAFELVQIFLLLALGKTYVLGLILDIELIIELLEMKESVVWGRDKRWDVIRDLDPSIVRRKSLKNFIFALPSLTTNWPMSLNARYECFLELTVRENVDMSSRMHVSTTSLSTPISIEMAAKFSWTTGTSPGKMLSLNIRGVKGQGSNSLTFSRHEIKLFF